MYIICTDAEYKEFIPGLLSQLTKVTRLTRGKYICLQSVLNHTGNVALFLELSPSLPTLVLKAMEYQTIALCVSVSNDIMTLLHLVMKPHTIVTMLMCLAH